MTAPPRVLMLMFSDPCVDPRAGRHARALARAFDVVTCGYGPGLDGITHIPLPGDPPSLPLDPLGLAGLVAGFNRWAEHRTPALRTARSVLAGERFDLVLACNEKTLPVALDIAKGAPVVADMAEYPPRQHEDDWRWRLVVRRYVTYLCRTYLPRCRGIVTVSDGIAAQYRADHGLPVMVAWNSSPWRDAAPRSTGEPIRLVYAGAANPDRRIECVIDAVAGLPNRLLDLYLVPAPHHRAYLDRLRDRASATPNVRVMPAVEPRGLIERLAEYDVGLALLPPTTFNLRHCLPNKVFQFVQARLAVVTGPSPDIVALVGQHGLGPVTDDFTATSLRATLASLNPVIVDSWKSRSDAAAPSLDSRHDEDRLARFLAGFLPETAPGPAVPGPAA